MSSINVSLGLIIGKTTHNSVRILVEFDKGEDVVCYMTSEKGVKQCKLRSKAGVPVVFSFTALEPKTFYKVSLSCKLSIKSSFSTLRDEQEKPGNLRVAVISCNDMSEGFHKTEKTDIHKKVKRNELDYVFHIDDQVYMDKPNSKGSKDDPYSVCKSILASTPQPDWEARKDLLLDVLRTNTERHGVSKLLQRSLPMFLT